MFQRKALTLFILVLVLAVALPVSASEQQPQQPTVVATTITTSPWTAEYFDNRDFTGTPDYGASAAPGFLNLDWGTNAPLSSIPVDDWGSRFTAAMNVQYAGNVTFEARADDTVTVWVDGQVVTASAPFFIPGAVYRGTIYLGVGTHTVVVQHTDITDKAFLNVTWSSDVVSGVTATVQSTIGLNFRDAPSLNGNRIGILPYGVTYPVLGRNGDASWAYLDANGLRGWASTAYLAISGNILAVPVLDASTGGSPAPAPAPGVVVTQGRAIYNVIIRSCPATSCARLGVIPWQAIVDVYGQSTDRQWVQIKYGTIVGWGYKDFIRNVGDYNVPLPDTLPVTQ